MSTRTHSDYEVFEELGKGTRTVVYAGYNRVTDRNVAIKEFANPNDPDQRRLLRDTAHFLAGLPDYEHVIELKGVVPEHGWLILDRMRESLADWLARENRGMPTYQLRGVLRQALEGLETLHRAGRWMGNVRPSNLLVDDEGRVKLADSPGLVVDGVLRPPDGQARYIAPERVDASFGEVGPWTDLYSLGFTALELLVGPQFDQLFPVSGAGTQDPQRGWLRVHSSRSVKLPRASEAVHGLPPDLARVIDRLLQKDVAARYHRAGDALRDLEAADAPVPIPFAMEEEPATPAPIPRLPPRKPKPRVPTYTAAVAFLAASLLFAGYAFTVGNDQTAEITIETNPAGAGVTDLDTNESFEIPTPGPFTLSIKPEPRRFRIEKAGYEAAEIELVPTASTAYTLTLKPKPAPRPPVALSPNLGDGRVAVRIACRPESRCEVIVDGILEGRTPLELRLPAGSHRVGVRPPDGVEPQVREIVVGREPVEEVWVFSEVKLTPKLPTKLPVAIAPAPKEVATRPKVAIAIAPAPKEVVTRPKVDPQPELDLRACDEWLLKGGSLTEFLRREAPAKLARWQAAATGQNLDARVLVGHCLARGVSLPANPSEAVKHYAAAEAAGITSAAYWLGVMHESGQGVPQKDWKEAARLYKKAASRRYSPAMHDLGDLHLSGKDGLAVNEAEAIKWYRQAAELEFPAAVYNLGVIHEKGLGTVKPNEAEAVKHYEKATALNHAKAMTNLGLMHQRGVGGLAKSEATAVGLFQKAAQAGDPNGMYILANAHRVGLGGLKPDDAAAAEWYLKAAKLNHPNAATNLGVMYTKGLGGLPKDDMIAVRWYRQAADLGNAQGMFNLGLAYESGQGVPKVDKEEALKLFRQAADLGHKGAREKLGNPPKKEPVPPPKTIDTSVLIEPESATHSPD